MAKWIIGFHAVEEYLKTQKGQANLYVTSENQRTSNLIRLATKCSVPFRTVGKEKLVKLTGNNEAKDCALQIFFEKNIEVHKKDKSPTIEDFLQKLEDEKRANATILLLDQITDPHNLGAILRSCDQFGVDCVVIPQKGSAKESATVLKTSAGASRYVKIFVVPNLKRTIDLLKEYNFWIYGTTMDGEDLNKEKIDGRVALIMGSEGKGMRALTTQNCDKLLTIPTCGHIDSLNVSVACGIILYQFYINRSN